MEYIYWQYNNTDFLYVQLYDNNLNKMHNVFKHVSNYMYYLKSDEDKNRSQMSKTVVKITHIFIYTSFIHSMYTHTHEVIYFAYSVVIYTRYFCIIYLIPRDKANIY